MILPGTIEIATLVLNTVIGAFIKLKAAKNEMEAEKHIRDIELFHAKEEAVVKAREHTGPKKSNGFHWTRRTIALLAVFFIVCWPKIVPVFWGDVPVVVSYSQFIPEGLWRSDYDLIKWVSAEGIVVTPLDTMIMLSVLGLFLGSEIAKRR